MYYSDGYDFTVEVTNVYFGGGVNSDLSTITNPENVLTYLQLYFQPEVSDLGQIAIFLTNGNSQYNLITPTNFVNTQLIPPPGDTFYSTHKSSFYNLIQIVQTDPISHSATGNPYGAFMGSVPDLGWLKNAPSVIPPAPDLSNTVFPIRYGLQNTGEISSAGEIVGYAKINNTLFTPYSPNSWGVIEGLITLTKSTTSIITFTTTTTADSTTTTTSTTTPISPIFPVIPPETSIPVLPTPPVRPSSLKHVETIWLRPDKSIVENIGTCSSDSKGTLKTIESDALSFGPLAPGETSQTMIIYLKVPSALAINNIKIGLIDCGGLTFGETKFGVEIQSFIDYNIVPSNEFTGVNSTKDPDSLYNITVGNKDSQSSNYVYLNMVIPQGQMFGSGTLRLCWFFDFA